MIVNASRSENQSLLVSGLLLLIVVLVVTTWVGTHAWDDGSITLAFAKTFAESHRIAMTPLSEQVEGFSSVSWFLINAIAACFRPEFADAILASQLLTAICCALCLLYMRLIAAPLRLSTASTTAALAIAALSGPFVAEISNGMEMALLAACALCITYHLFFRRSALLVALASLVLVATRFEAIFYFAFLIAPLIAQRRFRETITWLSFASTAFASLAAIRYQLFAAFLPNTIYAKMHPPYSKAGMAAVASHLEAVLELVKIFSPLLLALGVLSIARRAQPSAAPIDWSSRKFQILMLSMPIASAEIFAAVTGTNMGYPGRMEFIAIPYVLLLGAMLWDDLSASLSPRMRAVALLSILMTVPLSWVLSARLQAVAIHHRVTHVTDGSAVDFAVTPAAFRDTGLAVDRLRQLLNKDAITFMTPDIGGASLCCERLRIVDAAMLANAQLARGGYAVMPAVLRTERPDVIEIHALWAEKSRMYQIPEFTADYVPIMVDGTRLFLRKEEADYLLEQGSGHGCSFEDPPCLERFDAHRYRRFTLKEDDEQFRRFAAFVEVRYNGASTPTGLH